MHNASYEKTERQLKEAFYRLILKKPVTKITVTDITRECGIHRDTFYEHYPDSIPAFIRAIKEDAISSLGKLLMEISRSTLSENKRLMTLYQSDISSLKEDKIEELLQSKEMIKFLDVEEQFLVDQIISGCVGRKDQEKWQMAAKVRSAWGSFIELSYYASLHPVSGYEADAIQEIIKNNAKELLSLAFDIHVDV